VKNDLPYFSHDNDAHNHAKMKALRARFGWAGYGQFWALNEMIAAAPDARLDLSRKVVKSSAACELGMTPNELDDFLKFLSDPEECGLIHIVDNLCITTDRTQENYRRVKEERERHRTFTTTSVEECGISAEECESSVEIYNKAKQSKANKIKEEQLAARANLSTSEKGEFELWAIAQARTAGAKNPRAYARRILDDLDRFEEWRESKNSTAPPDPKFPDPGPCPVCGEERVRYPGIAKNQVMCLRCRAVSTFDQFSTRWLTDSPLARTG
jgi:hypothetical protein